MVISQKASEKNVGYRGSKSDFKEVTSYTLLGFALSESTGLISFILINIFFHFTFFLGSADSADLLIAITPIGASHFCTVTGNDNSELVPPPPQPPRGLGGEINGRGWRFMRTLTCKRWIFLEKTRVNQVFIVELITYQVKVMLVVVLISTEDSDIITIILRFLTLNVICQLTEPF
jgi:hypothetical protein